MIINRMLVASFWFTLNALLRRTKYIFRQVSTMRDINRIALDRKKNPDFIPQIGNHLLFIDLQMSGTFCLTTAFQLLFVVVAAFVCSLAASYIQHTESHGNSTLHSTKFIIIHRHWHIVMYDMERNSLQTVKLKFHQTNSIALFKNANNWMRIMSVYVPALARLISHLYCLFRLFSVLVFREMNFQFVSPFIFQFCILWFGVVTTTTIFPIATLIRFWKRHLFRLMWNAMRGTLYWHASSHHTTISYEILLSKSHLFDVKSQ